MNLQQAKLHLETSKLLGVDFLPVAVQQENHSSLLKQLHKRHDANCPHCTQATGYTQTVFGSGNPEAQLMFLGEAPGAEEDKQGIPFVGEVGKKLNEIISAMGMQREDVYIANILKSKPPNNQTPSPQEVDQCGPFLIEQIVIVQPKVIVALGSPATNFLLKTTDGISELRGSWGDFDGIAVMPTFHPAYLLRNYTKEVRAQMWSDMQQVIHKLKKYEKNS